MKTNNLFDTLKQNAYPGRGIVLGTSADGASAVAAYFIMGRSENSRNRVFVTDGDGIRTQAFDPSKMVDPSLIIYAPVRVLGDTTIVTNGDQTDTVYDQMLAGKTFEESLRIHTELNKEERYQKAIEMMKEVELPDPERLYRQYPHELSGGMRQRVMIAAAMICNPRILIADEPTTALDVTIQAQIVELLKRMNREKQTSILFISHDLSLVKQLCERVLVMKGGYIVETGLTQEVFAHPKEEYTQRLIAAIPKVKRNGK